MFVQSSFGDRLGAFGSVCAWPVAETPRGQERLDVLLPPTARYAEKLSTPRLENGFCTLTKPAACESIAFRLDAAQIRYIGVWLCHGGWPDSSHGHYTLALEPCSGRPDSLAEAIAGRENGAAGAAKRWTLRIQLSSGAFV